MGRADYNPFSLWQKVNFPRFSALNENLSVEVCVVGAGISGLMTAYELQNDGFEVVILDQAHLGDGETGLTSAHLSSALDDGFDRLIREHGEKGARMAYQSHAMAIDEIERIIHAESIDCDFRRLTGYLVPSGRDGIRHLDREWEALQKLGIPGVERTTKVPSFHSSEGFCIAFHNQGEFHPGLFIAGLARAILRRGGRIFTETHVSEVIGGDHPLIKTSSGFEVSASDVVLATGVPVEGRFAIHTKQAAYRTYVIAMEIPKDSMKPFLWWDNEDPYHYVRLFQDHENEKDYLLVGGEDHRTGQDALPLRHFDALESWARTVFPQVTHRVAQWSGQIIEPADSLAFIGRHPSLGDHVFTVSGDSGHGLTHGAIAGMLLRDLISGRLNDWEDLYKPSRKIWNGVGTYLTENMNTAMQYADWLSGGEVGSADEIPPGQGAIVRSGMNLQAVFRTADGELIRLSAMCPHLGGVVRWNSAEQTWDCPCHGSRFDCEGRVLNGPARVGLEIIEGDGKMIAHGKLSERGHAPERPDEFYP